MTPLCALDALAEGMCLEFEWQGEPCFLLRHDAGVTAYHNRCPHRGVTLNWRPDDFLTEAGDEIRCASHDARFRLADGLCTAGPCDGKRLAVLALVVEDGVIYVRG